MVIALGAGAAVAGESEEMADGEEVSVVPEGLNVPLLVFGVLPQPASNATSTIPPRAGTNRASIASPISQPTAGLSTAGVY